MRSISYAAVAGALVTLAGITSASADVVFTDNNFADIANYSGPSYTSDPGLATINYNNASNQLQFISTFNNFEQADTVAKALVNSTFTYNPHTQGAISDINASILKTISTTLTGTGLGNHFYPTIEQDGVFYLAQIAGPTFNGPGGTGPDTLSQNGLTASDFVSFSFSNGTFGTANPNFGGDLMTFGLTQISGTGGPGAIGTLTTEYTNLSIDIVNVPVPEPAALTLLGGALLAVGAIRRRRGRSLDRPLSLNVRRLSKGAANHSPACSRPLIKRP